MSNTEEIINLSLSSPAPSPSSSSEQHPVVEIESNHSNMVIIQSNNNNNDDNDEKLLNNDEIKDNSDDQSSSSSSSTSTSTSSSSSSSSSLHSSSSSLSLKPHSQQSSSITMEMKNEKQPEKSSSSYNNNNNDDDNIKRKDSSQEEIVQKLMNQVQSYINECFEMEEMPEKNTNNNDSSTSSSKPVINQDLSSVAILPIEVNNQQQIVETKPQFNVTPVNNNNNNNNNNSRVMTIPSIHITNEHGQDRRISIDINHQNNNNNDTQTSMDNNNNNNNNNNSSYKQQKQQQKVAVVIKNVSFSYTKKTNVLSNINLVVPKAQIFALLGASGCGKTTLLRIILGRLKPKKGDVQVFGARPGGIHSNIPGSGVGFMPQELAMFPSFTIAETLYYFGLLHHIPKDEIIKRTDFMIELLNLPPKDRKIEQCSGGQQRRASIALTLFHSPPLLILDEPTVGVDPLLRLKIWQYLEYLCINNRMTIIITTHYIEESRRANNLAFMRFGRILAQDSPDSLLQKYNTTVLEDVFLQLCQHDCGEIKQKHSLKKQDSSKEQTDIYEPELEQIRSKFYNFTVDKIRLKALFFKNIVNLKRNPLLFFFFLLLPTIQIVLFCISVYKSPDNIEVSIFNNDTKPLSKRFLDLIDERLLRVNHYNSLDEAIQTVINGKAWLAIEMSDRFSAAYRRRAKNPSDLSEQDFNNSKIKLYPDQTDNFIHNVIDNSLMNSYQKFVENIAESFGYNPSTVRIPVMVQEVVHGKLDLENGYVLLDNLIAGSLVAIIYTTPLLMSGMVLVMERKDNIIERTFVNGATSIEVFLTHLITLMLSLIIQVIILLFVAIIVFDVSVLGPLSEVYLMLYLQGLTGIFIGLLISAISKNEIVAVLLSLGMVFPLWMISGVFWPLESIDAWLQKIFWMAPLSYPIRSTHHMFRRGWTFAQHEVFMGYVSSFIYNIILLVTNVLVFHFTSQ
ncbi:ABC transporter G family member 23 isoform X2 [Dermatophagoides farinae]